MQYPLTSAQKTFYTEKLTGNSPVWNEAFLVMFDEDIDDEKLNVSINQVTDEDELLHTAILSKENSIYQKADPYIFRRFPSVRFNTEDELLRYLKK